MFYKVYTKNRAIIRINAENREEAVSCFRRQFNSADRKCRVLEYEDRNFTYLSAVYLPFKDGPNYAKVPKRP